MSKIILAADKMSLTHATELAERVGEHVAAIKIHSLYDQWGREAVAHLKGAGARVWVDFKLHDIPETTADRIARLADAGADIVTVHAAGGVEMMRRAVNAAGLGVEVYAVTVLTSIAKPDALALFGKPPSEMVRYLAHLAAAAGVHGVVCSPQEVKGLFQDPGLKDLQFITPGIRSAGKDTHDQQRVGTPRQAIEDGADYLVIGRQITEASDPVAALAEIEAEIADA